MNCFGIEMVLCDLYLKRFDLTKGLLFETFLITVWYKLCRCDHSVLELESFSPPMVDRIRNLISNVSQFQKILLVDRMKNLKSNASHFKKNLHGNMRRRPDF